MGRIIRPLGEMGAQFESDDGKPPVKILPGGRLRAIRYDMPIASAQVKSAILLAGLSAEGETAVREPAPTRDHTERMLRGFHYPVSRSGEWVSLKGGGVLQACDIEVPGDLSSAAFFIVLALISPGAEICLKRIGVNPTRSGILTILQRMGADITLVDQTEVGGEPIADIVVKASTLHGVDIDAEDIALAVDEAPVISVAAACAKGVTEIHGAQELRVKESDRITTTVAGLRALGIEVKEYADGMKITGGVFSWRRCGKRWRSSYRHGFFHRRECRARRGYG